MADLRKGGPRQWEREKLGWGRPRLRQRYGHRQPRKRQTGSVPPVRKLWEASLYTRARKNFAEPEK